LDAKATVRWLGVEIGALECVATPASPGGLLIEPAEEYNTLRNEFIEALGTTVPEPLDAGEQWVNAARLLATAWRMTVNVEAKHISVTVPEPARHALQLKATDASVVVFGFGGILEIWEASKWHEHVHSFARERRTVVIRAIEDLES
jgi:DNA-binding transcriptional regulator/RsmH inhibitor MraZ